MTSTDSDLRLEFHDPLSRRGVVLVVGDDDSTTGVEHAGIEWVKGGRVAVGCDRLADVTPQLDSAFCANCLWQARISGAWYMDVVCGHRGYHRCGLCGEAWSSASGAEGCEDGHLMAEDEMGVFDG